MHIVIDARIRRSSTGRYIDRLLEYLQKIDSTNKYTILLEPDDPWHGIVSNFNSLPCPYKQFSFNPLEQIGFAWQLYRLRSTLAHFSMTQQPLLFLGKIITTTHDLTMLRFTRRGRLPAAVHIIRIILYRLMFWWSLVKSEKIIVPSMFVAKDLGSHYPFAKRKIVVTHEASEPLTKAQPKPLKTVSKPYILHVGSPFPHKNIYKLVESFLLLKKDYPNLQLVLPGKKEFYFKELEKNLTDRHYRDDIIIPGFINDQELKWLYENAECYVLPSLSEGFGLPGLEAMVHGCPVVSSNATCLPEIYGDAALYFDPLDINDMAQKISSVLNNRSLRRKLIKKGYEQAKKYSWERMAKQTLDVYYQVLNS